MQRHHLHMLLAFAAILAAGTTGYMVIEEGWTFDALYMTFITASPPGYGETHALSPAGRVFTMFLLTAGGWGPWPCSRPSRPGCSSRAGSPTSSGESACATGCKSSRTTPSSAATAPAAGLVPLLVDLRMDVVLVRGC